MKIKAELTDEEYDLLKDILGHVNIDVEEVDTFNSMRNKLTPSW